MIVGHVDVVLPGQYDTVTRRTRSWCSFDVDAFLRDVTESPFVRSPPTDVNELYYSTNTLRYVFNELPRAAQSHGMIECAAQRNGRHVA